MPTPPTDIPLVNSIWEHRAQHNQVVVLETRWVEHRSMTSPPSHWEIHLAWLPKSAGITAWMIFGSFQHWYTPVRTTLPPR